MCNSSLHEFLCALPKCEHHMHLEGALTPQLVFQLAVKNQIELPTNDAAFASPEALMSRYTEFTSLDDFLQYYYIGMNVLCTRSDFEALAWDYFEHASRDSTVHVEVFFDPQAHLARGIEYEVVVSGFTAARHRAEKELGISSELICCFLRHLDPRDCLSTFEMKAIQDSYRRGDIIGIGLDSSEKEFPPELFANIYSKAKSLGMKRTAHAGEEGPASYIRSAIDTLDVERIDHGIRLADDPDLLNLVAAKGILLSICPLSNIYLQCAASVSELPIRKFLEAGVPFSINSDDPAYFGNHYIGDNYCAVQEAFELTVQEWKVIGENSIRGSWCSDERELELLGRLRQLTDQWETKA